MIEIITACISGLSLIAVAWVTKGVSRLRKESVETHSHVVNDHGSTNLREEQDKRHAQVIELISGMERRQDRKLDNIFSRLGLLETLEITHPRERK